MEIVVKKTMTFSFSALTLTALLMSVGATPASAECMARYQAAIKTLTDRAAFLNDSGMDCSNKMYCMMPMTSSLGLPNMTVTSDHMSTTSRRDALIQAYRVIREAESGGGVHLIEFRDSIRDSEKALKSVDLDYVAQAVRDANNKEFFCASGDLVDVKQMLKIVISLL